MEETSSKAIEYLDSIQDTLPGTVGKQYKEKFAYIRAYLAPSEEEEAPDPRGGAGEKMPPDDVIDPNPEGFYKP